MLFVTVLFRSVTYWNVDGGSGGCDDASDGGDDIDFGGSDCGVCFGGDGGFRW